MDTATRLAEVQAAISAIVAGGVSSYSIGSRSAAKLSINDLRVLEKDLLRQLFNESGSGAFSIAKLGRRR